MKNSSLALFSYGFRPFFLGAACVAVFWVPLWLLAYQEGWSNQGALDFMRWHQHEMLFGFMGAAIAGFLLTAVPNWTGERAVQGLWLKILFGSWLLARLTALPFLAIPSFVPAFFSILFMPLLIGTLAPSLVRTKNRGNYPVMLLLGFFGLADALFWVDVLNVTQGLWDLGMTLGLQILALLVIVIGGRVIPNFTAGALARRNLPPLKPANKFMEPVAIGSVAVVLIAQVASGPPVLTATLAVFVAFIHGVRLFRWQGWRASSEPLVWSLHLAYAWIPVGFLLLAISLLTDAPAYMWQHAFGAGAFTTMILGIMCRVALGHTGRPMVLPRFMQAAFVGVTLAALVRVFGVPLEASILRTSLLTLSGLLWTFSFALYLIRYAPILLFRSPR